MQDAIREAGCAWTGSDSHLGPRAAIGTWFTDPPHHVEGYDYGGHYFGETFAHALLWAWVEHLERAGVAASTEEK